MSSEPSTTEVFTEPSTTEVFTDFDTSVTRLVAVKKAAYRFGDRCHIRIELVDTAHARVYLRTKRRLDDPIFLLGELQNEVLDQELREVIAGETATIRNLLLAQAFSATSLLDPQGESAAFEEDPLAVRDARGLGPRAGSHSERSILPHELEQ